MTIKICIGTKKGAFILTATQNRNDWKLSEPIYFGNVIYHFVCDKRNPNRMLIAAKTGHLGPTVFISNDRGISWNESKQPPRFSGEKTVNFIFWLTPGHASETDVWYAGTSPQGLFKTEDGGQTWDEVLSFSQNELIRQITENNEGTPIGPLLHSINVDPRDKNHICLAMSTGGFIETKDGGQTWGAFNKNVLADFLPTPYPDWGQCVHNLQQHPGNPDIYYQQGHCGVYKVNLETDNEWTRIGENIPKEIGDIGFPLILHPMDENKLWVVPMDGTDVWPRTSVNGKPALYHSDDGGSTWLRQDKGFPTENAWFTVMRQATAHDNQSSLGLYVGTKAGELWASFDEGNEWRCITRHLPEIYSIEILSD
ncbi:MAG: hypothetical protein HeimC2_20650 [Candidatus Heimdallarchaeota archaeon LC_2]|nr:MAG: hypothetical protein HeimC2_20650 [Candidatus Heimdallarchaeota archaeon LC_2]